MPRPTTIEDDALLAAARAVFGERGPLATTAEVAARAGVSEGSLFKRWKSKAELFAAAMDVTGEMDRLVDAIGKSGPLDEEGLRALARQLLAHFERIMPVVLVAWSNVVPSHGEGRVHISRALAAYEALIQREMSAGRLRPGNAASVSRMIAGALWHFAFIGQVVSDLKSTPEGREAFVHDLASSLYRGIRPVARSRVKKANLE